MRSRDHSSVAVAHVHAMTDLMRNGLPNLAVAPSVSSKSSWAVIRNWFSDVFAKSSALGRRTPLLSRTLWDMKISNRRGSVRM